MRRVLAGGALAHWLRLVLLGLLLLHLKVAHTLGALLVQQRLVAQLPRLSLSLGVHSLRMH
jgi:hypothetical protein